MKTVILVSAAVSLIASLGAYAYINKQQAVTAEEYQLSDVYHENFYGLPEGAAVDVTIETNQSQYNYEQMTADSSGTVRLLGFENLDDLQVYTLSALLTLPNNQEIEIKLSFNYPQEDIKVFMSGLDPKKNLSVFLSRWIVYNEISSGPLGKVALDIDTTENPYNDMAIPPVCMTFQATNTIQYCHVPYYKEGA